MNIFAPTRRRINPDYDGDNNMYIYHNIQYYETNYIQTTSQPLDPITKRINCILRMPVRFDIKAKHMLNLYNLVLMIVMNLDMQNYIKGRVRRIKPKPHLSTEEFLRKKGSIK